MSKPTAAELLRAAADLVEGARADDYGDALTNFTDIADAWSLFMDHKFVASDVAIMMSLLKVMRMKNGVSKDDNFIDGAAYLALAGQLSKLD